MLGTIKKAQPEQPNPATTAFHGGKEVRFIPAPVEHTRALILGDRVLGPLLPDQKPSDHRRNLYVVCPGTQNHADRHSGLAFNLVLNSLPQAEAPVEWDVYWVVVLDPALPANFDNERDLLLAAQYAFEPGESFTFEQIPGVALLRNRVHINSLEGLDTFRYSDGTLPRLIIVPSRLVIRASAFDSDSQPSNLSRAWSHLSGHKDDPPPAESVK